MNSLLDSKRFHFNWLVLSFWLFSMVILGFIILPLIEMLFEQPLDMIVKAAQMPDVTNSILLSLEASFITAIIAVIFGTPLSYILARTQFPYKSIVEAIVNLPLAVPHTVAGIALLFVFGKTGPIGHITERFGISFWGTIFGIIVGMLFVSSPYMINSARLGFENIDIRIEKAARTLGATNSQVFFHISLPLAFRSILSGMVLTYARSIAEFGAVIILAYHPETAPVKIYELFLTGGLKQSSAAAVLLLIITISTFILFRYLTNLNKKA
ncbi:tungstate/molybdate transport system permease protein [Thermodesulfobium acidiphilum]|uniref:Tungstate/molybdate transport system permease protein n=1 Tax=Thermodesulfobium acidiphilum TaxID=1794699 RepID=A0A2R4W1J8_THEAF|nr:ABC transporter permease [Thermodesulfobium acidiphilum]AWB10592.1 tungstate/molybdate transport system permease protein [Thermodesulfobium acidiphilum]